MSRIEDARYFAARAASHRRMAEQSDNNDARRVHRELGERYAAKSAALLPQRTLVSACDEGMGTQPVALNRITATERIFSEP